MCGIAGIFSSKPLPRHSLSILNTMLDIQKHRGPDDRGTLALKHVCLGHLRLSILDLTERGHQPMSSPDGNLWITYNGEIYNYIELRQELENFGHSFSTQTDTEVILHAYQQYGTSCFERFNGMWALALWDMAKNQLILSRDRLGIKPLYWFQNDDFFVFGSEIKTVLAWLHLSHLPIRLHPFSINTYIETGLVDGREGSFFKGVFRFKAGHYMILQKEKEKTYTPYWEPENQALSLRESFQKTPPALLIEQNQFLLRDAVEKHSRSDVPVGVCLSGGLDSSTIAAIASKIIPNLSTFTSWFSEGKEYNELEFAEKINRSFHLNNFKVQPDSETFFETLKEILWYLDEPSLALGVYPQWHVMEISSKNVKVVLDGQGGDELFAGYDFYVYYSLYSRKMENDFAGYQRTLSGFSDNYGPAHSKYLEECVAGLEKAGTASKLDGRFPDYFSRLMFDELTKSRLPALLRYEDRLSMAFSIESRVPLLDYRLVEFALALPEEYKIGPGWTKYILRQTVDSFLPREITWRKDKKGFPTPLKIWVKGVLKPTIIRDVLGPDCFFRKIFPPKTLDDYLEKLFINPVNDWSLWRLLSLETWFSNFLPRLSDEIRSSCPKAPPIDLQAIIEPIQGQLIFKF